MRRILIATSNAGKVREMRAVLASLPVELCELGDVPPMPEVVEDGDTFEANALKKALSYAEQSGLWTLADDSGLEVDALGGAPGVHSARYSGTGDDLANNRKLIAALAGVSETERTARFVCCLALVGMGKVLATARGTIEGRIIDEPRGQNGFGYDPHFYVPELQTTTAELTPDHKNRISHRGIALLSIIPKIQLLLESEH